MIQNNGEYQVKYREYMNLLSLLQLAQARTEGSQQFQRIKNTQNKLLELEAELSEYKEANSL